MKIELRPFSQDDQDFLYRLYASTRMAEIALFGWNPAQQEAFLRMQFNAQQRGYEMAYKDADHQIITGDSQPVGRILVHRGNNAHVLVDIALLDEYRNRGIGTRVLQQLIASTAQQHVPLRLQVIKSNPARHLYERLGFVRTGEEGMHFQMEKQATSS